MSEAECLIRPAVPTDSPAIARVHVAAWQETYAGLLPDAVIASLSVTHREAQWRAALERTPLLTDLFVAEMPAGAIAGFVACGTRRGDALREDGEIYAVYLLREHQRRGVGRLLMRAASDALRGRGCRSAAAWVLRDNLLARGFYERLGGAVVAERNEPDFGLELAYAWRDLNALAAVAPDARTSRARITPPA